MDRRTFIRSGSAAAVAALALPACRASGPRVPTLAQPVIPRWRGFNLTELTGGRQVRPFLESDFEWMAEWGFDFARLPMSYWSWSSPDDWLAIDDTVLAYVDQAVEFGRQYGVHVNLNFHRIPGWCVNGPELEPHRLFAGPPESQALALEAASHHWRHFAERYRGIPSDRLSFDLFNEPPWMQDQARYVEIARTLVGAIREIDPDRLIVADGADIGQTPVMGLVDLGLVQSTRGYLPKMVSHYTATWVPENEFESLEEPTWPMTDRNGVLWDRDTLRERLIVPWLPLVDAGVPVHVGEWGCYIRTPHDVAIAWMTDLLSLWKEMNWGWAMWNLRGQFGIVDSGRADVQYEAWRGHLLDRRMLEMLKEG